MIEILETIAIYTVGIIGTVAVLLDLTGFLDSDEEDNRYHLSDVDDLDAFEDSLAEESQEYLSEEIKRFKEKK